MILDPKITNDLLYGDDLCRFQRRSVPAYIWDDDWVVFGDQDSKFGAPLVKHFAVQFRRRPKRMRDNKDAL